MNIASTGLTQAFELPETLRSTSVEVRLYDSSFDAPDITPYRLSVLPVTFNTDAPEISTETLVPAPSSRHSEAPERIVRITVCCPWKPLISPLDAPERFTDSNAGMVISKSMRYRF